MAKDPTGSQVQHRAKEGREHMRRTFSLLFVFFFFVSCGKKANSSAAFSSTNEIEREEEAPELKSAVNFEVNAITIGFNRTQEEKVLKAAELIKKVVASEEFKQRVLDYKFKGKRRFHDTSLSNEQIYRKILEGSEKMTGLGKNNTMDLELELYTDKESNTIGYTYPNIVRVYVNRKYFNKFQPHQVADNMMHEWLHKIGFDHEVKVTKNRRHSVPYAIGYIVKALALKHQ